ncbi:hypothetical protein FSP39_015529 [Pinctada imbricata]|uniref:Serine-threonine kinase receptor-associated protein n=1 Tax=Pinctada imbricata TaxID=66713 RepID=A0AA88XV47_PINIB|nr:hypothetical protein FSP39_015529 [Pinctada imbricata]
MSLCIKVCLQVVKVCLYDVKICLYDVKECLHDVKVYLPDVKKCLHDVKVCLHDVKICLHDVKTGKKLLTAKDHSKQINDIQLSKDMTMLISASKDTTSKLFDTNTLRHMKTYKTERPVNSASLSPIMDHVVLGGGQEAMDVTTTSTRIGKFDARFFNLVFEEEFGRVKGHFGPINSTAFHPDGKSYSSGGEDGYVRVHYFDPSYFEFRFEF